MEYSAQISAMQNEISSMRGDLQEIKEALLGNPEFQKEGYISKINKMDQRLERIEQLYKSGRYFLLGLIIAGGYGVNEIIGHLLEAFKHK